LANASSSSRRRFRICHTWLSFWTLFGQRELEEVEPAARSLGLQVTIVKLQAPYDFQSAFKTAKKKKAGAVVLLFSSEFYVARARIATSALEVGLATAAGNSQYTKAGGLLSYGPEGLDAYHRVAYFVDRLLKGANSDLPVEQPTKFTLAVNLKTAKAANYPAVDPPAGERGDTR
jgi:putative ABC transport system substrate-binding protein